MKTLVVSVAALLAYLGAGLSLIWIAVSFLIYLVKDAPFNWNSVWCFVVSAILSIVFGILTVALQAKGRINKLNSKKSAFQDKLEEMAKNRNK